MNPAAKNSALQMALSSILDTWRCVHPLGRCQVLLPAVTQLCFIPGALACQLLPVSQVYLGSSQPQV